MERNTTFSQRSNRLLQERTEECLQLTGSQMNLTSRSQKSVPRSPTSQCTWKSRPYTAYSCYNSHSDCHSKWKRPLSADNELPISRMSKIHSLKLTDCPLAQGEASDFDPNSKHCYTYMSSHLLRNLIRNPWNSDCSESISNSSESEKSLGCMIREMAEESSNNSTEKDYVKDCSDLNHNDSESKLSANSNKSKDSKFDDFKFERWLSPVKIDEKIVRFSQDKENIQMKPELEYNQALFESPKESTSKDGEDVSCSTVITDNDDLKNDFETFTDSADDICHYKREEKSESENENKASCSSDCPFSCSNADEKSKYCLETEKSNMQSEEPEKELIECSQKDHSFKEKNIKNTESIVNDSTYDEIVTIINVLEQEETNSLLDKDIQKECKTTSVKKNGQLEDIYSYLEEVEKSSQETIDIAKSHMETVRTTTQSVLSSISSVPRLEDLLSKNTLDLAHEVLSLKIQIEDMSSGMKLLQKTITEMKEAEKLAKSSHEEEIYKVNSEAEMTIQRHQKFIKQLLQEKKALNEKVGKLVEDLKAGEERYQRNLKTIEQRHAIEIQRVKETQAVAEKLKREKWIDIKTQKIKEMTVKGLEPELARMAARQQQEMTELRNLHRSELEAVELRAARRTTELLEQLRSDLNKDKEEVILRETNMLRTKLEKQFEEERSKLEHDIRKLKEERRREKEIFENKEVQIQETYSEMKRSLEREKERERQRVVQEMQEQLETLKRRHQNEMKTVRETLEIEKEAWMNNYKKQQNAKFLEREAELHHQYKRERDKDIEMVIERLENESSQAQQELSQAAENKFRRMKEKYEQEIKESEKTEATLKAKLSDAKSQLLEKDDKIADLNSQLHHLQSDMNHIKKLCEEMSAERSNIKEIIAKEFEAQISEAEKEVEDLRSQIMTIKNNHILELAKRDQLAIQAKAEAQQELNQVYNRVKMTVSKKEEALEVLREQHKNVTERCSHLEKMLENQRRNLLLK